MFGSILLVNLSILYYYKTKSILSKKRRAIFESNMNVFIMIISMFAESFYCHGSKELRDYERVGEFQ